MPKHSNLEALKSLYEGDRTLFFERLDEAYVCHTPGRSQIAGRFVGPQGMMDHGRQMRELTDGTFKVRLVGEILINDVHAMAPVEVTAVRSGRSLKVRAFGIWRFEGDRIVEHWECPLDMEAFDAFWAD